MKSLRENIVKIGSLLLVFILPLIVSSKLAFPFISIKTFFFYGATELIFVFWIYSVFVDKSYRLSKKQLLFFVPVILYIIWMSIAGVLAVNPSLSFWSPLERGSGLLTLYHALAFSFVVASLIRHDGAKYTNRLLKYFIFGSFILALSVWLGDEGFKISYGVLEKSSGGGFIGNSSLTSTYLIFSLFLSVYILFAKGISKNWKIFSFIVFATIIFSPLFLNIYGLLAHKSIIGSARGALLGILIGLGIIFFSYLAISKNKIIRIFGIISIFIAISAFSIGWISFMKPGTYLHEKFTQVALGNRFIFWDIAQKSIDEHPFFGYGPENYMIAFRDNFNIKILDDKNSPEGWNDKAHNIYFDTGVSGGYGAIAFYGIFLLSIFYSIYRAHKIGTLSQIQASILWGLLVSYIFQNLFVFDSPLSLVALFMLIGIVCAIQEAPQSDIKKEKHPKVGIPSVLYRNTAAGLLFVFFIISFVNLSYLPLVKSRAFARVTSLPINVRPGEYMSLLGGSKAGNDWDASYFSYDMYLKYKANVANIRKDPKLVNYVDTDLTAYLAYLEKLSETNKTDYRLYLSILHIYNIQMSITGDKFQSKKLEHILSIGDFAHKLSPNDPQVYWDIGFLKLYHGDKNGALEEYKNAVNIDKTIRVSWTMLMNFLEITDQKDLYNATLKEAQTYIPDFVHNRG